MGNTVSISIPTSTTPAVKPPDANASNQNVIVESTPSGGVRVKEVQEPTASTTGGNGKILGKFDTQDDLIAAYKELESQKGKKVDEPIVPSADTTTLNIASAAKVLTDKGLDYSEFANQYAKDGALSSASYEKLFSKGITAQQIDAFITGQAPVIAAAKAAADVAAKDVKDHVGGSEEFAKLIDFVAKTLTPAEIASYNRAVDAGDTIAAKIMLANFKAQRDAKLGNEPNLNGGNPPNTGATNTYSDIKQYHNDIADPRYAKDSFFRKTVDAKLERSKKLYT